jgi:hypothetical protein
VRPRPFHRRAVSRTARAERESVAKDYVSLAISILEKEGKSDSDSGLKAWAVDLLNKSRRCFAIVPTRSPGSVIVFAHSLHYRCKINARSVIAPTTLVVVKNSTGDCDSETEEQPIAALAYPAGIAKSAYSRIRGALSPSTDRRRW